MTYQRAFDFGGADAVSGNVEDVVGAAENGDVSILIFPGDVAGDVASGKEQPVALVTGRIAPDGTKHAGERAL